MCLPAPTLGVSTPSLFSKLERNTSTQPSRSALEGFQGALDYDSILSPGQGSHHCVQTLL